MPSFSVNARSAAPPEAVWSLLATASSWPSWTMVREASLEREGNPAPDGVGAIRRFRTGPATSREEVVVYEPPRRFSYVLLSGLPVRDYRSDVELEPDGAGTLIGWSSSFNPAVVGTGWLACGVLRAIIAGFARRLARAAERA